ncbi:MAG: WD40 repeat domain-containing protein [Planctomycetota bacterium]|nr:WD40 repeat domain-containing protein [Planctomycetota bacterium]
MQRAQRLLDTYVDTWRNQDAVAHIQLFDRETLQFMEQQLGKEIEQCQKDAEKSDRLREQLSLKHDPAKMKPVELLVARIQKRLAEEGVDWTNTRLISAREANGLLYITCELPRETSDGSYGHSYFQFIWRREKELWKLAELESQKHEIGEVQRMVGLDGTVTSVRFHPNGMLVASSTSHRDRDGQANIIGLEKRTRRDTIKLWDTSTGELKHTLPADPSGVLDVAFYHKGQHLAAANHGGTVSVWDWEKEELLVELEGHTKRVNAVAFMPTINVLISASEDQRLIMWDYGVKSKLHDIHAHRHGVYCLAVHPSGRQIATGGADDTVKLWNDELERQWTFSELDTDVQMVAFSPDGKHLAACGYERVVVWDLERRSVEHILHTNTSSHFAVVFGDNNTLFVGDSGARLTRWNLKAGERTLDVETNSRVYSLAFHAGRNLIASGRGNGTIRLSAIAD